MVACRGQVTAFDSTTNYTHSKTNKMNYIWPLQTYKHGSKGQSKNKQQGSL